MHGGFQTHELSDYDEIIRHWRTKVKEFCERVDMPVIVISRIAVLLWLVVCALLDLRRREVPDGLTLPAVVLAFGWRALDPGGWLPWVLAGVTVILTLAGVLSGGDMKGLVAMALVDPRLYLLA
ncbi:A24 family peptidase, partial [uncultured Thermanaerothrix sp.]|uniref:A24 family peptidase n=1 Tax=uncultured Thermanaerothrix sp. TaxID=1195149 RepID=UPI002609BEBF